MSASPAIDPFRNATVSASAGSGKTWLLVTRIVRLLLAGNEPGNILALTFTRKAATEMSLRLNERLLAMATAGDDELDALLSQIGVEPDAQLCAAARALYERVLFADYPVRLKTFHSFCQDILTRFALEADVPPGFELLEDISLLRQQAWEQLLNEATRYPEGVISRHLDTLMDFCNGPDNTRGALFSMLDHRSDWWAYIEGVAEPVTTATADLADRLGIEADAAIDDTAFVAELELRLREFVKLAAMHTIKDHNEAIARIETALAAQHLDESGTRALALAFLKQDGEPRKRKQSATLEKKLGTDGAVRYMQLHEQMCAAMLAQLDRHARYNNLVLNTAWYALGHELIERLQRIKRDSRLLDFSDLEWHCYKLMSAGDNALWVQYKLDSQIDHILVDEFQDTNPTQWHLLAPLLDEMAASWGDPSQAERMRSVFIVGDEKQSIYSFRRANPALQQKVSVDLAARLDAAPVPLVKSWRSSPAIMGFVNAVFEQDGVRDIMPGYRTHDTHRDELDGSVSLLGQFSDDEQQDSNPLFRDPLTQPRVLVQKNARIKEAQHIAACIEELIDSGKVDEYSEIMILMRNRTHMQHYEEALQDRGIPFLSDRKGGLLDNLEIRDLERLLDVLITPFDNLALAQVLKSPLFDATDEDLLSIARAVRPGQGRQHWYQRLLELADSLPDDHVLHRAAVQLERWRLLADTVPVHDLLQHIYSDAEVLARYACKAPQLAPQLRANLQRFIQLALDVDSGRYPSLGNFKHYLWRMREHASDQLGMPDDGDRRRRVRIMTIHGSKGLESRAVFLADANNTGSSNDAWSALVEWPEDEPRPTVFQLQVAGGDTDSRTHEVIERKATARQREELNLLYVALTRAEQYLFVSAVESRKDGWYPLLASAMQGLVHDDDGERLRFTFEGTAPPATAAPVAAESLQRELLPVTRLDIAAIGRHYEPALIAPSLLDAAHEDAGSATVEDEDAALRGLLVHRLLELRTAPGALESGSAVQQAAAEFRLDSDDAMLAECVEETSRVLAAADLAELFDDARYQQAFNELPLLYELEGRRVYGLVDRLCLPPGEAIIVDYKSHRVEPGEEASLAQRFAGQIACYRDGVKLLWPERRVKSCIVFTRTGGRVWLDA